VLGGVTVEPALAALAGPFGLRLGNALELPLPAQVRLELGEHPEHVEERLGLPSVEWRVL
jgi:hypothetical protein